MDLHDLSLMSTLIASISCITLFIHLSWMIIKGVKRSKKRLGESVPEAAGSWPIIGHLHLLARSQVPHKLLGSMADKFGPIFTIKLGVHRVLVVSSPEMAKECLTTNDRVFASRPKAIASELMGNNYANVALAPHGPYWREIRKIIMVELMSRSRLQVLAHIQVSEVESAMRDMYTTWIRDNNGSSSLKNKVKVDMTEWFGSLILNMVVRMMFGDDLSFGDEQMNLQKAIRRFAELLGVVVPSDAIPWLRWLDVGGYEKKMKETAKGMDVIDKLLEEHKKKMNSCSTLAADLVDDESKCQASFMTTLLFRVKEKLNEDLHGFSTDEIVKATCLSLFAAATDATSVTLTWALSLLVNNPLVLKKAQEELDNHIGRDRKVEESDLKKLVYLQAIIKETMRLYPAAPLSVPHESTEECILGGYTIPKGTRLLVNVWKIHHDPKIWTDPFEFQPERFLTSKKEIDVKGQHFELLPFGSGRRMCLGMPFALEVMPLILANIIHGFEFENPSNEQLDMTESLGLTNLKATPLELLLAPRLLWQCYGQSAN